MRNRWSQSGYNQESRRYLSGRYIQVRANCLYLLEMTDKIFKTKEEPSDLIVLGENGEDFPECAICNRRSSGVAPDYFVRTREGHQFHYACMKEIVDAGGEAKCPKCDDTIGFDMLTKRIESMEAKRLSVPQEPPPTAKPMCNMKFVVLGHSGVGKSSLLQAYVRGRAQTADLDATRGVDVLQKLVRIGDRVIRLSLWDTAGQEKCSAIVPNFLRNAHAILFVYSITDTVSFQKIDDTWIPFTNKYGPESAIRVLIGNKSDQEGQRKVLTSDAERNSVSQKMGFFETSAKEGINIEPAIRTTVAEALEKVLLDQESELKQKNYYITTGR